ncbi:MAG TPA: sugar nucleotide-binding protein [Ilumatobacter sp.]
MAITSTATRRFPRRRPERLFVTGGAGFLGRHVVNGPAAQRWELVAPSSQALDLRNPDSVRSVIGDWRPTAIIHTAYRRDDRASIVAATRHVAEAAARSRARLVHVSTDALFGGRSAPYREADDPTPITDYGRWKAEAEQIVADTAPGAVVVRTSLLFGGHELSPHELAVRDAIEGRSAMAFFTDEIRSPGLVDDVAAALVALAGRRDLVGRLHLGGPEPLSRADLARRTAQRHGWDASRLRFSTLAAAGMVRPARVVLDSSLAAAHGLTVRGPAAY